MESKNNYVGFFSILEIVDGDSGLSTIMSGLCREDFLSV